VKSGSPREHKVAPTDRWINSPFNQRKDQDLSLENSSRNVISYSPRACLPSLTCLTIDIPNPLPSPSAGWIQVAGHNLPTSLNERTKAAKHCEVKSIPNLPSFRILCNSLKGATVWSGRHITFFVVVHLVTRFDPVRMGITKEFVGGSKFSP